MERRGKQRQGVRLSRIFLKFLLALDSLDFLGHDKRNFLSEIMALASSKTYPSAASGYNLCFIVERSLGISFGSLKYCYWEKSYQQTL